MTESGPSFFEIVGKFVKQRLHFETSVPGTTIIYHEVSAGPHEGSRKETLWSGDKSGLTDDLLKQLRAEHRYSDMFCCVIDERGMSKVSRLPRPGPGPKGEQFDDISA